MSRKEEILELLDKEFNIILTKKKELYIQRCGYKKLQLLIEDVNVLIHALYEEDFIEAGKRCRKDYIPALQKFVEKERDVNMRAKYAQMLEEAYRISARTNFEDFVRYYEWNETDKFFEPRYPVLKAYAFYLNRMVFDPNFNLLIVNLPSGTGKTYLEKLYEAFSYGVDPTGTCLYICSNEDVVTGRK